MEMQTSDPGKISNQIPPSQLDRFSPQVVFSRLSFEEKNIYVVRDDLLDGGTKQRACADLLLQLHSKGFNHFIYASPFSGFAQVALAYVASQLKRSCQIFCEKDQTKSGNQYHKFSLLAQKYGAAIEITCNLQEASQRAHAVAALNKNSFEIPLGFDCPEFRQALKEKVQTIWDDLCSNLPEIPRNIWIPVGSGTLANTIRSVVPSGIRLHCVNVQVLRSDDLRLERVRDLSNVHYYQASQFFHEPSFDLPPIPSNLYYDAKLWSFIKNYGENGDLWWNVAR